MPQMINKIRETTGVTVRVVDVETLARLGEQRYGAVRHMEWRGFAMTGIMENGDLHRIVSIGEAIRAGAATPIKQRYGRTAATLSLRVDGRHLTAYVKEDDLGAMGIRKLLKDNLQRSRPWKTWQRTLQLLAAGVDVQRPIAVLEYRRLGLVRKAVYVGEYAPEAVSLARLLGMDGPARADRHRLLAALAGAVRRMHDRGFYHGDLKAGNLLAVRQPDRWEVRFIDLEGVVAKRRLTGADRAVDLARLRLSLEPMTTLAERDRLLESYAAVDPAIDQPLLRDLMERRIRFVRTRRFGNLSAVGAGFRAVMADQSRESRPRPWLIVALGLPEQVNGMASLLAVLGRELPAIQVDALIGPEALPVLEGHRQLRAVMTVSDRRRRTETREDHTLTLLAAATAVRSNRYGVVIDLTDRWDTALLTRMSGAAVRIGYRRASLFSKWPKRVLCYNQMILSKPGQRDPVRHALLVAEALDLPAAPPVRDEAAGPVNGLAAASSLSRTRS